VKSVESSARGFVLTGKESYLGSNRAGATKAKQVGAAIRALTGDNPKQRRQLPALERLAAEQIQLGESVIVLRQTQGQAAAADSIRTEAGQRSMDEFELVVREMQDEEMGLLVLRDADAKRRLGQTKTVLILGTFLGLLITAIAGWSAHRDSSEGLRAEGSLRDSEEQYRGLLEAAPDAMVVVDPGGEIVLLNVQAEKQFGYNRDELVGQKVKNIIPQGFAERRSPTVPEAHLRHWRSRSVPGLSLPGGGRMEVSFPSSSC
jgi:CHASE3 domain sensor protein